MAYITNEQFYSISFYTTIHCLYFEKWVHGSIFHGPIAILYDISGLIKDCNFFMAKEKTAKKKKKKKKMQAYYKEWMINQ